MMARKLSALFVLAAFSLFNLSCLPFSTGRAAATRTPVDPENLGPEASDLRIVGVSLKTGASFSFDKNLPARLTPDSAAVTGMTYQSLEIPDADIMNLRRNEKAEIVEIETKSGLLYKISGTTVSEGRTRYSAHGPITIPLSDVQQLWIKKSGGGGTSALTYIAAAGLALGVILLVISTSKQQPDPNPPDESCPFVYSWNGGEYVRDAEPYGAAVSEGLKRTDWIELSSLRPAGGQYLVLLTNELDETQYTDELKLVVVDHAPGVKVAADLDGRIRTFSRPLAPVRAVDRTGKDITPFIRENDLAFWLSPLEGLDPDAAGDFRDELTLEFPKPAGAKTVKLLANVWSSPWASFSGRAILELYGSSLDETYRDIDRHGPAYDQIWSWMAREDLFRLRVQVETADGWKVRGEIMGGAPFIAKDRACVLDVADVPGEALRLRLTPAANFWAVNAMTVDYGEDLPVRIAEIAAEKAIDRDGRDVRAELAATDGRYLESPYVGDRTELVFPAPPLADGLERTVLVKASGYYRIHVDASGQPQAGLIERIIGEPGFAARYTFCKYLEWEAGLRAQAAAAKH